MLRRVLLYASIVLILGTAVLLLTARTFIRTPIGTNQNIDEILSKLETEIETQQWTSAAETLKQLHSTWEKLLPQVQFSIERQEEMLFEQQLIRLNTAIKYQDPMEAETEYGILLHTWKHLGN